MEGELVNGFPARTAFRRVHGDSTRCEGVGDQEGHPGHGFEGLLWSKCAWGANIWGPVIPDGGREGAPIGLGVMVVCQVVRLCWAVGGRTRMQCCGTEDRVPGTLTAVKSAQENSRGHNGPIDWNISEASEDAGRI
ncbi:hypothetical protein FB451DRAFT_1196216 [Mycena latifolia]|nr:hypothetical protein FB451DRAFT_1196216 [Mycena latifolia]